MVFVFLKDTGRAAVVEDQEALHFLGHRRNRQAVARAYVAHDHINFLTFIQIAQLLNLLGRAAGFVDIHGLNLHPGKARFVVGCRCLPFVEGLN